MRAAVLLCCGALASCARNDKDVTPDVSSTTITSAPIVELGDTDFELARRVEGKLAADPELSFAARNVHVTVNDGIVTLAGSVDDVSAKQEVGYATEGVPGIVGALNKIDVTPSRNENDIASDENIAFAIQRALRFDPSVAVERDRVTIEVVRGNVTLRGSTTAPTHDAMQRIAEQTPWRPLGRKRNPLRALTGTTQPLGRT